MIESLKFVKGAVAKKDFVPNLTHFQIRDGLIKGYNGQLALCSPIECDLAIAPHAAQFVRAINACEDTIALNMTSNGRLSVKSGRFKNLVDCVEADAFPEVEPKGDLIKLDGSLLDALSILEPFVSIDASKPWSCGILLRGQSAFATNNVILTEYWLGYEFPVQMNIPHSAIKEILRIKEEPVSLQCTKDTLTLHYEDGKWLSTKLLVTEWPDVESVLARVAGEAQDIGKEFFDGMAKILPFCDKLGRVYFAENTLCTARPVEDASCLVEVAGVLPYGCFSAKHICSLEKVATKAGFAQYPAPCPFYGDCVRGVILGFNE